MLTPTIEKSQGVSDIPALAKMGVIGYFILGKDNLLIKSGGVFGDFSFNVESLFDRLPMLVHHIENPNLTGAFYKVSKQPYISPEGKGENTVYIGPTPNDDEIIGIVYDDVLPDRTGQVIQAEISILSLITQAVRSFNRANDLEDILKIVLIGVTAGSGLGFNRAFILLTCDDKSCLKGTLANGPSSPEEAGVIWGKLSSGELTLEMMFDDVLQKNNKDNQPINELLKGLEIPLDKKDNIFVRAALEKKSMIIDEPALVASDCIELNKKFGRGPLAIVPLVGEESLQGVLIADNFITNKEVTKNDLHLLEIFARYACDSIEKFRLNERLEKKVEALKRANETIILGRENLIKSERLSVLAEMAGQVAHEVRNPLTVIGGFIKSMINKVDKDDENYQYFDIIIEQVRRIEKALEKFSSLVNYQEKNEQVCELGKLVSSTVAIRTPGMNIPEFIVKVEEPISVKIDPDLFRQALLIVTKKIGLSHKSWKSMELSIKKLDKKANIYFEPSCQKSWFAEEVYKSFHSGGDYQSRKDLSIALEILKYYGGNIGLEVQNNDVMRFYLELPIYKEG